MGEVFMYHATHWLTDPSSLQFLVDGECIGDNHTPTSLSLAGLAVNSEIEIDFFLPQGGPYRAQAQRLSGPLLSGTKQPQRPPPPPEPPPRRASSSSDYHSYCGNSNGCYKEKSSSWNDEDSHHSGGPRSDRSWENDSSCSSYVHSYGSCDRNYDSMSTKQNVCENHSVFSNWPYVSIF